MFPRTEREEACLRVFSRVSGPCVKAATVVVCASGCVVVVDSVGARELGLVGVGAVLQFVLTLRTGPDRSVPLAVEATCVKPSKLRSPRFQVALGIAAPRFERSRW